MLPLLHEVCAYTNPRVIARYQKDFPNNKMSAADALREVTKYLWLCQKLYIDKQADPTNPDLQFRCDIHQEMNEIDDMWHTFILFTRDYQAFCEKYFGCFMHHEPNFDKEKMDPAEFEQSFTRFLSYAYDHLGEETVTTWFAELLQDETI